VVFYWCFTDQKEFKVSYISCASAPIDGFEFQCLIDNKDNDQVPIYEQSSS
jgi:hypothetical protein